MSRVSLQISNYALIISNDKISSSFQAREEQAFLEMKHRKEEDDLYRRFAKKREDEERRMANEFQDEWERELQVRTLLHQNVEH